MCVLSDTRFWDLKIYLEIKFKEFVENHFIIYNYVNISEGAVSHNGLQLSIQQVCFYAYNYFE